MVNERIKASVVMQQSMFTRNAPGSDDRIDSFTNRHPQLAQGEKVPRSLNGDLLSAQLNDRQRRKQPAASLKASSSRKPCKTSAKIRLPMASGSRLSRSSSLSAGGLLTPLK